MLNLLSKYIEIFSITYILLLMHIDNRKELLYRTAFKMFLTRHFESVTISDIENATGMTRGAITYYAKNKMGLFKAVVKHYIIDKQNINYKFDSN